MIRAVLLLATLVAAAPALADGRVQTRFYDPAAIVPVTGQPGIQSTIEFGADEHIENVAIGDSSAWQVTPNRRASLLFLKPMLATGRTNMTVVTDRRTYMFELVAYRRATAPLYNLRFRYPEPTVIPTVVREEQPPLIKADARPTALDLDFGWAGKGAKTLLPRRAFDDGQALYLTWDEGADLPAMLAVDAQGVEGPVNYSVRGDYVVIDRIPDRLVLRSGKGRATLARTQLSTHPAARTASVAR